MPWFHPPPLPAMRTIGGMPPLHWLALGWRDVAHAGWVGFAHGRALAWRGSLLQNLSALIPMLGDASGYANGQAYRDVVDASSLPPCAFLNACARSGQEVCA